MWADQCSLRGVWGESSRGREKALSPQVRCLVLSGRDRRLASEEGRLRDGSVVLEQVGEVGGGLVSLWINVSSIAK